MTSRPPVGLCHHTPSSCVSLQTFAFPCASGSTVASVLKASSVHHSVCCSLLRVAVIKHSDQKQSREGRIHLVYTSRSESISEDRKDRSLKQKPCKSANYWLASQHMFRCSPFQLRPICLGIVLPTVGQALLLSISHQESTPWTNLMETIPQLKLLLPTCCQVNNQN